MKLSFKQLLLLLILLLSPLFLSLLPFIIQSFMAPSDRVFMGLHRWSEDYYGYLQLINQGIMGHIQAVSKLTLMPHQPTFVHSEYLFLGVIGGFFGLNSVLIYHLSRLILGAIFVMVAFYFLYFIFSCRGRALLKLSSRAHSRDLSQIKSGEKDSSAPRHNFVDVGGSVGMTESRGGRQDPLFYSILSFFLAFFAGGFPHIISLNPLQIEPYLPWWTETFVLTRSTILPHYLMGNIFFLLILILFLKFSSQKRVSLKSYVLYLISGFLLAFVHPIDFLILICSLGLFVVLQIFLGYCSRLKAENYRLDFSLRSKNIIVASIISTKYQILLLLLIFISGFLPALYYRYALSLPFWRFILAHGTTTAYNIPLFELGMALGPVFFLGIGGIIVYFFAIKTKIQSPTPMSKIQNPISKNKNAGLEIGHWPLEIGVGHWQIGLLLFSWLFAQTLFFLFLYQVFNFDRLRTMEAPFYLALAFFATYFIMSLRGVKRRSNLFPLFWLACPAQLLRSWVQNPSLSGPNRTGRFWSRFTPQNDDKKIATPRNNSRNLYAARNDIIVIVLIFLVTLPTSLINLHNQIYTVSDFKTFSLFSYPTVKQYQSWQFLRNHTPDNSAITSLYEAKFLIPTVSGNKIAFGANFDNNANYQNNVNKINQMYAGLLNPQDLRRFLKQNNISYVYWGYQEQSLGGNLTKYNFLQKVFDNGQVVVFAVK